MSQDKLEHYGIPGMKWGIRKDPARNTGRKGRPSSDRASVNRLLKKRVEELSDADLTKVLTRLSRESQVKSLTKEPPKLITTLLKDFGKAGLAVGGTMVMGKLLEKYGGDPKIALLLKTLKRQFNI